MIELRRNSILLGLFLVALMLPLISLPLYYDDYMRFHYGYVGLTAQARPFAEFYYFLMGSDLSSAVPDIYTLNITLSACILFIAASYVSNKIDDGGGVYPFVVAILLLSSPFMLENFSYHVDIISMTAAYGLSIYGSAYTAKTPSRDVILSLIILLAATLFYPAALSAFGASVVLISLIKTIDKDYESRAVILYAVRKYLAFFIAAISLFIINKFVIIDGYYNDKSKMVKFNEDGLFSIIENAQKIIKFTIGSLNYFQLSILSIISFLAISYTVYSIYISARARSVGRSLVFIFCIPSLLLFMMFPNVILSTPTIEPRTMFSFGIGVASIFVLAYQVRPLKHLVVAISIIFSLTVLATSSAYVSTSKQAYSREVLKINDITNILKFKLSADNVSCLNIVGETALSSIEKHNIHTYPVIGKIMRPILGNWHAIGFVDSIGKDLNITNLPDDWAGQEVYKDNEYVFQKSVDGKCYSVQISSTGR